MRRRWRWLVLTALLVAVVAWQAAALRSPSLTPGLTPENFRSLHRGMSRAEVTAILGSAGVPGDEYQDAAGRPARSYRWHDADIGVSIEFGEAGAEGGSCEYGPADDVQLEFLAPPPPGLLEVARQWVRKWTGW